MAAVALHLAIDFQIITTWINVKGGQAGEFQFVKSLPIDIKCKSPKSYDSTR
jgi:hypothetical protein